MKSEIVTVYRVESLLGAVVPQLLSAEARRTPAGYVLVHGTLTTWNKKRFLADEDHIFESAEDALLDFEGRERIFEETYRSCIRTSQKQQDWARNLRLSLCQKQKK